MATNATFQKQYNKKNNIKSGDNFIPGPLGSDHFETGGVFTCNGATPVTVADTRVSANSAIVITLKTVGGTVSPSVPYIATITVGTGFTVTGTASDTSTYNYLIVG